MINLSESDKQCIDESIFRDKPGKTGNFVFYDHIINYTRCEMEDDGLIIINSIRFLGSTVGCPVVPEKDIIEKFYPLFQWIKENHIKHTIGIMQKTDNSTYEFSYNYSRFTIKGVVATKDVLPKTVHVSGRTYNVNIFGRIGADTYLAREYDIWISAQHGCATEFTILFRLLNWLDENKTWMIKKSETVSEVQPNSDIDLFNAISKYLNAEKSKLKNLSEEKHLIEKQIATLNEQLKIKTLEIEKKANDVALNSDIVEFMKKTLKIDQ